MYSSWSASRQKWNRVAQGQRVPLEALGALGLAPKRRCCKMKDHQNNHQTITTNNQNTQFNHNNHNIQHNHNNQNT